VGQPEQQRLVAGAGDLEEHPALLLEADLAVVQEAADESEAVVGDELVCGDAPVLHCG
jgi:hypothetical protein